MQALVAQLRLSRRVTVTPSKGRGFFGSQARLRMTVTCHAERSEGSATPEYRCVSSASRLQVFDLDGSI